MSFWSWTIILLTKRLWGTRDGICGWYTINIMTVSIREQNPSVSPRGWTEGVVRYALTT